jgi:hypothetical protein
MSNDAGKRARTVTARVLIVVAIAFIIASTWQVAAALFFQAHAPTGQRTDADEACNAALQKLASALDRASERAAHAPDEAQANVLFEQSITPEWNDSGAAERTCSASPRGRDAWSSLLRLRRALEGRSQKDAREIGPVRRDFETRLP